MLITAFYNFDEPRLLGMPMFYWYQFAFVAVGVACVGIVYATTKNRRHPSAILHGDDSGDDDDLGDGNHRPGDSR